MRPRCFDRQIRRVSVPSRDSSRRLWCLRCPVPSDGRTFPSDGRPFPLEDDSSSLRACSLPLGFLNSILLETIHYHSMEDLCCYGSRSRVSRGMTLHWLDERRGMEL